MKPDQHIIDDLRSSVNYHLELVKYEYDFAGKRILEIAPDEHRSAKSEFINAKVETLNIVEGEDIHADICDTIPIADSSYDAVICFEVLEHTSNPFLAIRELRRVLKKGGTLYLTTPFMFRIHNPLPDNWRFTEHGLKELCKDFRQFQFISHLQKDAMKDLDLAVLQPLHYRVKAIK